MDKSLDEIVKSSKTVRRTGGRRPNRSTRAKVLGTTNTTAARTAAKKAAVVAPAKSLIAPQASDKIMVSGLPNDVDETQIRELFTATVGPVKSIHLQFNLHGKFNGTATVLFSRKGDGNKAYDRFNNRLIDGKKPLKIELIFDPSKVSPPSLASRVAPAPAAASAGAPMEGVQRVGRPRRARKAKTPRPQKTAEDLDAEMEDYTASTNAPGVAA